MTARVRIENNLNWQCCVKRSKDACGDNRATTVERATVIVFGVIKATMR